MATENELRSENEALRARLAALERERIQEIARTNALLAATQDRVYWLDRWHLDLNALMNRRGASRLLAVLRVARPLARRAGRLMSRLGR